MTFQKVNYEDLPTTSGVYILEIKNGKKYIGQTKNLRKRLREHFNHICGEILMLAGIKVLKKR